MERHDRSHGHGGGLSSGFLVGVVVGVVITLLLTTKKGKKILKMITEEGMSKISNFEDVFNDAVEEYKTKPQEPKLPPVDLSPVEVAVDEDVVETVSAEESRPIEKKEEPKTVKRFFKGIHRTSIN